MRKKLYSIGELINENIKLKKRLEKTEKENIKGTLSLLKLLFPNYKLMRDIHGLDIGKVINGFEERLNEL